MIPSRRWRLVLLLLGLVPGIDAGENGRPVVRTFGANEIHAKGPVLAFAEAGDGATLIGSNQLVAFDGVRWQLLDVPGAYGFRALAGDGARVWVGAEGAIGFAERDQRGVWKFTSLGPAVEAAGQRMPVQFDRVSPAGAGAIFVSRHGLLRWDGHRIEGWPLLSGTTTAVAHQAVLLFQPGVGLARLGPSGPPELLRAAAALPCAAASWIISPEHGAEADGVLLGSSQGVYRLTADGAVPLPALAARLAGQEVRAAVNTENHWIALGTQPSGMLLATRDGEIMSAFAPSSELIGDGIRTLWSDRRDALWMGLDNGCARLDHPSVATVFDAREGLERGLARRTIAASGATYVVTDKAVYRWMGDPAAGRFLPVVADRGRLNDAADAGGALWVAGERGLGRIEPGQTGLQMISSDPVVTMAAAPWLPGIVTLESRHLKSRRLAGTGAPEGPVDFAAELTGDPRSLLLGAPGEFWVANEQGVVEHLQFGPARQLIRRETFAAGRGLPSDSGSVALGQAGPRVFAFTDRAVLEWSPGGGFAPVPELAGWAVAAAGRTFTGAAAGPAYWLAHRLGIADSPPSDILQVRAEGAAGGPLQWRAMRATGLDTLGEITSFDLAENGDRQTGWVGGKGGLIRLNWPEPLPAAAIRDLALREVRLDDNLLLPLQSAQPVALQHGLRSLEFGFSAAQPMEPDPAVYYQTRLVGAELEWSPPQRKTSREFTGLAPGSYTFLVRRYDRYGRIGAPIAYPFVVLPPWYQRWPSRVAFAGALAALAWLLYRWRVRALRSQTERLNRLVAKRTRELELSNTAKSEFLENISHEIRNPLNGIVGLTRLLHAAPLGPAERQLAKSLHASAEHLRRVSEDVLDLSKAEFGNLALNEAAFSLRQLLREVVSHHAEAAAQAGAELRLAVNEQASDTFVGDESKIRTVVSNFIANAVKYAPGGPVEVRADWTDEPEKDAGTATQVFIAVTDTGPGVPAEEQELIFQKFVRGTEAKRREAPGSGIGLATCRTLARHMEGSVSIESPPNSPLPGGHGPGSAFHLWLPLRRAAGPVAVTPVDRGPDAPVDGVSRALIVDDEAYNRLVVAGLAAELGYETVSAAGPEEAREALVRQVVDLVFLDLELSAAKGIDLARSLRAGPHGSLPLIFAITGSDSAEARQRCAAAGMDGFLLKPFSREQISAAVTAARRRTFELYARGAGKTVEQAEADFFASLQAEAEAIAAASAPWDRPALKNAGHRLRTLGALGRRAALNALAIGLETTALGAEPEALAALTAEIRAHIAAGGERPEVALHPRQ
jgi:signal transduction histidine kinase/CheY-like chemotaxis protein